MTFNPAGPTPSARTAAQADSIDAHSDRPAQSDDTAVGRRAYLALPDTAVATAALQYAAAHHTPQILNHSVRSFLFARLLQTSTVIANGDGYGAKADVGAVDLELLFLACILHDIGLTAVGDRAQRFEIDGADVAAEFLTAHGVLASDVDAVWDAIALHSTVGPAARRSPLCALTQAGIWADFGHGTDTITDHQGTLILAGYPRHNLARELVDQIVAQTPGRPGKAPRYSFADALVQERATQGRSRVEADEAQTRWFALKKGTPLLTDAMADPTH